MLVALRIVFYLQFLLGFFRSLVVVFGVTGGWVNWILNQRIWETHTSLGILITLLALIALRPLPQVEQDGLRNMARFAPILPLLTGMLLLSNRVTATWFIVLHLLLGLAALGLIEMASARQRRARSR